MFNTLLITFGIEVILTYLAQLWFSADFRTINPGYAGSNFAVGGITIPLVQVIAFAIAIGLTVAMWLFLLQPASGAAFAPPRRTSWRLGFTASIRSASTR